MAKSYFYTRDYEDILKERIRVIDHLKRLFALISGFAIAVACGNAYYCWLTTDYSGLLEFFALIVTIPPIFHGAERSLDVKYLQRRSVRPKPSALVFDFSMLILTSLFFVALASSIPGPAVKAVSQTDPNWPYESFRILLASFLFFDSFVLLAGIIRTRSAKRKRGDQSSSKIAHAHPLWIAINLCLGLLTLFLVPLTGFLEPLLAFVTPVGTSALFKQCLVLATAAFVRTVFDYYGSWSFLYPEDPPRRP